MQKRGEHVGFFLAAGLHNQGWGLLRLHPLISASGIFIPPPNEVGGGVLDSPCPSVRLSVDDMVSGAEVKFALEFQFQISYACWWWP